MKKTQQLRLITALAVPLVALSMTGCAALRPPTSVASAGGTEPIPRVQNCAVLSTGSPSRFACNGKVYTSFQLATIREKEAKKYASGQ